MEWQWQIALLRQEWAGRVEGTINGIGERAGNAAWKKLQWPLNIRQDYYQAETSIVLNETINTSEMVSRFSGIPVPKNKAVVGGNAFLTNLVFTKTESLKILLLMRLSHLNWSVLGGNSLPLGKLSGRHAFVEKLKRTGPRFYRRGYQTTSC